MAISQFRMIELINAALDYQQAFEKLQLITFNHYKYAKAAYEDPTKSKADVYRLFQELSMILSGTSLMVDPDHKVIIAVEHRHFAQAAKRNTAEATRQARRRGKLPLPANYGRLDKLDFPVRTGTQRDNSPTSLIKPNHLRGKSISDIADAELERLRIQQQSQQQQSNEQPSQSISSDNYYLDEAAAHKRLSAAAAAKIKKEYTAEQLAAAAKAAEAEDSQIESELTEFASSSHQPDMLQDLTSTPVQQFADEVFANSPKPANAAELDLLIEKELIRQRAIDAFKATDSLPVSNKKEDDL